MRNLICLLALIFASTAFAANGSGNVSNVNGSGGITKANNTTIFNSPSNTFVSDSAVGTYKTLVCANVNNTLSTYNGCVDTSTASNSIYVVPNAKKFYVSKICYESSSATAGLFTVGSATASFATGTATAPTGATYWTGAAPSATVGGFYIGTPATNQPNNGCYEYPASFPQNVYPFVFLYFSASSLYGHISLIGTEK